MLVPRGRRHPGSSHRQWRGLAVFYLYANEGPSAQGAVQLAVCAATRGASGIDGYAAELGLATELPAAIAQYRGHWIEYGVAERAYALQCPDDFTAIVSRYGHTAIRPKQYTASAFLASVLGVLSKHGSVLYHLGPATGRWKYNGTISWWAVPPTPDWESSRLSWSDIGRDMSYVPGAADQ